MLRISTFVQRYPEDGKPPKEATTAFLGYTHDYFYVAFVCNDSRQPGLVRAHMLARDALSDDDNVQVMLDTFHDERRALCLHQQSAGHRGIRSRTASRTATDVSFDTVWDTVGSRTHTGYVVLMRIPFASLYFAKVAPGATCAPGASSWSAAYRTPTRAISGRAAITTSPADITQDMEIEGFRDVERGQNLQFEPYALARNLRQLNSVNPIDPYFEDKAPPGLQRDSTRSSFCTVQWCWIRRSIPISAR